jgi:Ca-activated chloride channel family protein
MKNESDKNIQDRFIDELLREHSHQSDGTLRDEIKSSIMQMRQRNTLNKFYKIQAAAAVLILGAVCAFIVIVKQRDGQYESYSENTDKHLRDFMRPLSPKASNSDRGVIICEKRAITCAAGDMRARGIIANNSDLGESTVNSADPSVAPAAPPVAPPRTVPLVADRNGVLIWTNKYRAAADFSGEIIPHASWNPGASLSTRRKNVTADPVPSKSQPGEKYDATENLPWKKTQLDAISTFSIDVDNASYSNIRRMIHSGIYVPRDAVRIEECVNAFDYNYPAPKGNAAFAVSSSLATCPWSPENSLVRIAIKGKPLETENRPASNLVFLIDVSGSMNSPDKLPLVRNSMDNLVRQLDSRDHVAIVVYAGNEGVTLPSTRMDAQGRDRAIAAIANLEAGGSTNGGGGISRAYELAKEQFISGGTNRVILATDGDFNVGLTHQEELVNMVKNKAKDGIYLTVLGYGTGNLNDAMMDAITRDGNGNYYYIDSTKESDRVFKTNLVGTLVTIAKDVKIQVEFNPVKVEEYRLLGYSNRVLANEDFSNDKVDAGDIGSGHTVTAFYEIVPRKTENKADGLKYQKPQKEGSVSNEWMNIKLRHKSPEGNVSRLTEFALKGNPTEFDKADKDFRFASAVVMFGMKLRNSEELNHIGWDKVQSIAELSLGNYNPENRNEFVELVKKLQNQPGYYQSVTPKNNPNNANSIPEPAEVTPGNSK